ncbi:MAG: alpha/beta hydrolase [Lachnospiraceae bacterium]|nr:alpha/beta hydrolase [Lachnospiraceae bacterium]
MDKLDWILIIVFALAAIAVLGWVWAMFTISYILFVMHLKRNKKEKWSREDEGENELQQEMYRRGRAWSAANISYKKDVHIVNDGLNLYGEYYDFGNDKAVIMVPGRTDSLTYSYYFADVYAESGYNILTIDLRAHGESDGIYNTFGHEESGDIIKWAEYIHDNYGVKSVIIHSLCIGAAGGMYAVTDERCPDYLKAIITEGMYTTFYETFKNHAVHLGYKDWPVINVMDVWAKKYIKHTIHSGPIDVIHKCKKAILMIQGREDVFSLPEKAVTLYEKCGSEHKKLVWFEKGEHSMLKINDEAGYNKAISEFLLELNY